MCCRIAIIYNHPQPSRYDEMGESIAVNSLLDSVTSVRKVLDELGYEVNLTPLVPPLDEAAAIISGLEADFVFNLFEGFCGYPQTEAIIPDLCDKHRLPYTGCPGSALRLALNKAEVKLKLRDYDIATSDFQILDGGTLHSFSLSYPVIVKPINEDASHGIDSESVVYNQKELEKQVEKISSNYGGSALVEEFVSGREFNATILGDEILPISEIVYSLPPHLPLILTYEAKWQEDSLYYKKSHAVCPAEISSDEHNNLVALALAAFKAITPSGYGRVDMRQDDATGIFKVIEVNPNPDISPNSGAAKQAKASGMAYNIFIEKILALAKKENHK